MARNQENSFTKNEILELAREFKKRRNYLGLSQLRLSRAAGLSQSIINKLEGGKIDPNYSTVLKIDRALVEQEKISSKVASDVMISEIISVSSDVKIFDALEIMMSNDFSQLLVMDSGRLKGVVYEKSILDAIRRKIDIHLIDISNILEVVPIIVPPNYSLLDLKFIFQNPRTKFILVMDESKLLGLVTKSDLFSVG